MYRSLPIVLCFLLLSGCWKTPVVPIAAPPATEVQAAASVLSEKEQAVKAEIAANVETARKSNATQPDGPAKSTVEGELSLAATRLGTKADPAELLAGEQRARALADGRTEEARKLYAEASKQATDTAKQLAAAKADLQHSLVALEIANAKAERDIAKLVASYEQKIQDAKNEVMRDQVKWLNRSGAACAALAIGCIALCLSFGGLAALKIAGPFAAVCGIASLACFGLAQIVGQWWFKWAALGGCTVILAVVGAWLWRHARQGNLKAEAEARANRLADFAKKVVPTLDDAYETATEPVRKWLEENVFAKLSTSMNNTQKKTVHEIRATTKED